jgi:hypothetical protein
MTTIGTRQTDTLARRTETTIRLLLTGAKKNAEFLQGATSKHLISLVR